MEIPDGTKEKGKKPPLLTEEIMENDPEFDIWLGLTVTKPFLGYDALTHPEDKRPFTLQEQIAASQQQLRNTRDAFLAEKVPPAQVVQMIQNFIPK